MCTALLELVGEAENSQLAKIQPQAILRDSAAPPPDLAEEIGVVARSFPRFKAPDDSMVFLVEGEVEYIDVFLHPHGCNGFRNDDISQLYVPANHDLGDSPLVFLSNPDQVRVVKNPPPAQWRPRLGEDALLGVEHADGLILKTRMQFDLVDRRTDVGLCKEALQVVRLEVGDADRLGPALAENSLQGPPGFNVPVLSWQRPVNEVEVDVFEPQGAEAAVEGRHRLVVAM